MSTTLYPPSETWKPALNDRESLALGAARWGQQFERQADALYPLAMQEPGEVVEEILQAIAIENDEQLATRSLDMRDAWGGTVAHYAAARRPFLVHTLTIGDSAPPNLPIARALNNVLGPKGYNATSGLQIITIDKVDENNSHFVDQQFGDEFAWKPAYRIRPLSELEQRIDWLGDRLRAGMVVWDPDESIRFRPVNLAFLETNACGPEQSERIKEHGIILRDAEGCSTLTARIVAELARELDEDPLQKDVLHLFVADAQDRQHYEDARLLMATINPTYHKLFRVIYVDYTKLTPELAAYGICKRLAKDALDLAGRIDRFGGQAAMQTAEAKVYQAEEYDTPLPFDVRALEWFVPMAKRIFPRGITGVVRSDGYGPYTYLVHGLVGLMKEGSSIEVADVSAANLGMVLRCQEQPDDDLPEHAAGKAFEQELIRIGAEHDINYEGSYHRMLGLIHADPGDMMHAPSNSCQVNVDGYASYAMCSERHDLFDLHAAKATTLQMGGVMVSAYFTGKDSWRGWPAVPILVEDIRIAHAYAGMAIIDLLVIPPADDGSKEHGGETVLTLARRLSRRYIDQRSFKELEQRQLIPPQMYPGEIRQ